ncbi:hypothetical protein [Leptolyngbya sp. NM3-A1]|uniref:hypothetical protein n=1 Tax=Leptolyngbya sp. NM3-A1 TaxID=2933910 RepID=UPI0032986E7A
MSYRGIASRESMALLDSLLIQLRATWPMAVVVAEFVTVQDGQFIVRALVQVNGMALASGLAAAHTIEAAEDRAKERAIQALKLPASPSSSSSIPSPELPLSGSFSAAATVTPPLPAITTPIGRSPLPEPLPPAISAPIPAPSFDEDFSAGPVVADLYSHTYQNPLDEPDDGPDPRQVLEQMIPASELLKKNPEDSASSGTKKPRRKETRAEPSRVPESVDLSDVIAQTDVELQRLGWSRIRGRDYLSQTYNKQTRSELTELELYEFLSYLKAQPSPPAL